MFKALCLVSMLLAVAYAQDNSLSNSLKPSEWLPLSELERLPAINEVTLKQVEEMNIHDGADLANKMYHLSQVNYEFHPTFVPKAAEIPAYIVTANNQKLNMPLSDLVTAAKQQPNFGSDEVTVFITGLPKTSDSAEKANRQLIQAYMERYNNWNKQQANANQQDQSAESAEANKNKAINEQEEQNRPTGNLVIIDLGSVIENFVRWATLDVEKTGNMIGAIFGRLTNAANVAPESIHVVAQGLAAHVAGAAGRQYRRMTGHQLRRITALDPSKIFAKGENVVTGLARGDADFVDAIHTSAYGMGTVARVGDVDFYPNGPSTGVPGAENIVEASMRATRFYAETVRPGNERNFPAVVANSLKEYKSQAGHGRRAYMGIATDYDLVGDYILTVNPKAPFGKSAPAEKQTPYHNINAAQNEA